MNFQKVYKSPWILSALIIGIIFVWRFGLILSVFAMIPLLLILYLRESHRRRMKLKQQYEESLEALKRNPKSSYQKQICLNVGRLYYSSLRGLGGTTAVDEQAIANDLSVATGEDML